MINANRIVPVTATNLLDLYAVILKQDSNNSGMTKASASDVVGDFTISSTGIKLLDQPLKKCNITAASATLYFVADYAYEGFYLSGTFEEPQAGSADVVPDGSLYCAVLSSGDITITKIGL